MKQSSRSARPFANSPSSSSNGIGERRLWQGFGLGLALLIVMLVVVSVSL